MVVMVLWCGMPRKKGDVNRVINKNNPTKMGTEDQTACDISELRGAHALCTPQLMCPHTFPEICEGWARTETIISVMIVCHVGSGLMVTPRRN